MTGLREAEDDCAVDDEFAHAIESGIDEGTEFCLSSEAPREASVEHVAQSRRERPNAPPEKRPSRDDVRGTDAAGEPEDGHENGRHAHGCEERDRRVENSP